MAIAFPETSFTLVDSNGKKISIVKDLASQLKLNNLHTINERAENINSQFDYIIGRSVSAIPTFLGFSSHLVKNSKQSPIIC